MSTRMTPALAALLLIVGCVGVDVTRLDPRPDSARSAQNVSADEVRIFFHQSEVPGSYTRLALLKAHGDAGLTNQADLIHSLRKKAATLGANGLVLSGFNRDQGPLLNVDRAAHAIAIWFPAGVR